MTQVRSQRQLKVGERIRQVLSDVFIRRNYHIPELAKVTITVSEVVPSPDLRHASVYVTTLAGTVDLKPVLSALNAHAPFFSHEVAKEMTSKYSPKLLFREDTSFEEAEKMEGLLRKLKDS